MPELDTGTCNDRDQAAPSGNTSDLQNAAGKSPADLCNPDKTDVESQLPVDTCMECRICLSNERPDDIVAPCACTGTVKYAHLHCLQTWSAERGSVTCELCAQPYIEPVRLKLAATVEEVRNRRAQETQQAAAAQELPPRITWGRFWCHAFFLCILLIGVLYLALFVNMRAGGNAWTVLLWKVFTILLPLYFIGFWVRKTVVDSGALALLAYRWRGQQPRQ